MNKSRALYFVLFLLIIFLGIMSRKIALIPLYIGDLLYAVMIYFLVRILFTNQKSLQIIILSVSICYGIEFLQLYQAEWIVELRKTLFGRYVLGQGFLWSDILAYTFGVLFAFIMERIIFRNSNQKSA
ncbi:DUF2809 domain-containing protein [Flavobacterium sp. LC2016-13]|nr:DUF2809 domain-containing protein [Flavobacterium sp. LC2016-13]